MWDLTHRPSHCLSEALQVSHVVDAQQRERLVNHGCQRPVKVLNLDQSPGNASKSRTILLIFLYNWYIYIYISYMLA